MTKSKPQIELKPRSLWDVSGGTFLPLLLLGVALLILPGGRVSADLKTGCAVYQFDDGIVGYTRRLLFPSSSHISGTVPIYSDSDCEDENDETLDTGSGWVYADTEEEAATVCTAELRQTTGAVRLWDLYPTYSTANQQIWLCDGEAAPRKSRKAARSTKAVVKKKKEKKEPTVPTGYTLMEITALHLSAANGLDSGIQFQRVDGRGVGIKSVNDQGLLDAVDVWGNIGEGYEVYFPQLGRVIFLDAATAPRTVTEVPYEIRDGYTCAALDRAGTIVLVEDSSTCSVTTTQPLNLRDAPNGTVIQTVIPIQTTITAFEYREGWFNVQYGDRNGWVGAKFVTTDGDCGYEPII